VLRRRNPDGRMTLGDHLRELRNRVTVAGVAILAGAVVGWIYYDAILGRLLKPLKDVAAQRGDDGLVNINFGGMTDPFATKITVSLFVGVLITSPVWVMQIWGFIVPGLTKKEKRIARVFAVAAVPLFLLGCFCAFIMVEKAVSVLLDFTPKGAFNLQEGTNYLNFVLKFILAFGASFLLPVFLVALNLAGILPARTMLRSWRPAVMLIFVFAAVMTPTPDAYTMLFLASPMILLFFSSVGLAFLFDRRRAKDEPDWLAVPDDQASAL
jgi:sec-independent protein translocase protein TatC